MFSQACRTIGRVCATAVAQAPRRAAPVAAVALTSSAAVWATAPFSTAAAQGDSAAVSSAASSEVAQGRANAATQTAAASGGAAAASGGSNSPSSTGVEALRMPRGFEALLRETIDPYPDFPIKGITFLDVFPIFRKPALLTSMVNLLSLHAQSRWGSPDVIVGLDSRGFLFGPMMAAQLGAAFVPIRKKGKLPGECISASYRKEYGTDVFEIQKGAIAKGARVLIVDDLLATGGTMSAAVQLVKATGAEVLGAMVLVELESLRGYEKVDCPLFTLIKAE